MDCGEFLESYSDYLDRRFEMHPLSEYLEHLRGCPPCEGYDRVMQRGLHLFRQLEPPETTPDFATNLQSRVFQFQDSLQQRQSLALRVGALATVSTAALLVVAAIPILRVDAGTVQLPPVVVEARDGAGSSLWGPAPDVAPGAGLLLVPDFSSDPVRVLPSERPSLFRAPLRASQPAPISPSPEQDEEEKSAE